MLRSKLRLTQPPLLVVQATITNAAGITARTALTMPATPFGSPAWQLPALVSYLHRLHQNQEDPAPGVWRAHTERPTGPVPRPHRPYQANGLHDPDVICLLDIQLGPRETETGWPAADLTIIEQEHSPCPFGRVTHHHEPEAIAAHTAKELTAEHAALMDRAHQHHDAHFLRLAELAQRAAHWADKVRAAAHADTIHAQADRARARITH